jgi:hypothetical protein
MIRRRSRFIGVPVALAGAVGILLASSVPAQAYLHGSIETVYPAEGGKWTYGWGTPPTVAKSEYYHQNVTHGSTVILNGSTHRSICTAAGHTSKASGNAINTPGATDSYYYRFC